MLSTELRPKVQWVKLSDSPVHDLRQPSAGALAVAGRGGAMQFLAIDNTSYKGYSLPATAEATREEIEFSRSQLAPLGKLGLVDDVRALKKRMRLLHKWLRFLGR